MKKLVIIFILLIGLALSGCYPHIRWAEENGVLYDVKALSDKEWSRQGYPVFGMGGHKGKFYNGHRIIVREEWCKPVRYTGMDTSIIRMECNKYILNHELKHARYPDWNHWLR